MKQNPDFITLSVNISRHDYWRTEYLVKHGEWQSKGDVVRTALHEYLKKENCPIAVPKPQLDVPLLDKKKRSPPKTVTRKTDPEPIPEKPIENSPILQAKSWDSDKWLQKAKEQGIIN